MASLTPEHPPAARLTFYRVGNDYQNRHGYVGLPYQSHLLYRHGTVFPVAHLGLEDFVGAKLKRDKLLNLSTDIFAILL